MFESDYGTFFKPEQPRRLPSGVARYYSVIAVDENRSVEAEDSML